MENFYCKPKSDLILQFSLPFATERILAAVPLTDRMDITRDVVSAWRAASSGVTTQTEKNRKKYFGHWVDYCKKLQMYPLLRQHSDSEICIAAMAFAARVKKGSYGYGATVKVDKSLKHSWPSPRPLNWQDQPVPSTWKKEFLKHR
jgi:hypothetical protein